MERSDGGRHEVLASVPDAVVEVGPGGGIEHVDEQAERLFGWSAEELVGRRVEVLVADRLVDPGPRPPGVDVRLTARRPDGSHFPAEDPSSPVSAEGPVHRVALSIRDTTPVPGTSRPPRRQRRWTCARWHTP